MLAKILLLWVLLALTIGITALLLPGIEVDEGFGTLLALALLLSLINITIGTILRLITIPLRVITLGLFSIVIDAAVLGLTAWISDELSIDGIVPALAAAVLIAVIGGALQLLILPLTRPAVPTTSARHGHAG